MIICDYCGKELDRKVFCSDSHKVMYHRKGGPKNIKRAVDKSKTKKEAKKIAEKLQEVKPLKNICKHGYAPGLCKVGGCKNAPF